MARKDPRAKVRKAVEKIDQLQADLAAQERVVAEAQRKRAEINDALRQAYRDRTAAVISANEKDDVPIAELSRETGVHRVSLHRQIKEHKVREGAI